MIHREGYTTLGIGFAVMSFIILWTFLSADSSIMLPLAVVSVVLFGFLLWFFRNPKREFTIEDREVAAPVDGRVLTVERVFEREFLRDHCIKISIFMTPFDLHVTRYPVSGKVIYSRYHPGRYFLAWHPKSSTKNERTTVAVETQEANKVLFRQIAGFVARRIVLYAREGDKAEAGEEFGFIKFGSRVDVFLPLNANILAKAGQKTIGGETVIATFS